MRKLLFLLPVLMFIALAGYFGLALQPGRDPNALPSALIDKPAPPFTLGNLQGGADLALVNLKGQVFVLNFFASWCQPCRIEHPVLVRLATKEKLSLFGIDYKDRPDAALQVLSQLGDPFRRIGVDADGRVGLDFGVYGVPETYVIDRDGHIRARYTGPLTAEIVSRELLPLVRRLEAM
jgi:cytochrome c biogenesis protein CcmG/thiol:disulfide interchange protein DsbE